MDNDGNVEDVIEEVLEPADEKSIFHIFYSLLTTLQSYGWLVLFGCILAYYLYSKLKLQLARTRNTTQSALGHVNEEESLERLRRIEAARLRQQAQQDALAAKYLEEKRIKEEKAAQEILEDWERHKQGLGYHSKTKKNTDELDPAALGLSGSKPLATAKPKPKSDYNPLMGQGGSSCYRPSKRGGGGRGG